MYNDKDKEQRYQNFKRRKEQWDEIEEFRRRYEQEKGYKIGDFPPYYDVTCKENENDR